MTPLRELYPRLTSFANLHAAARRAQRGKRYRPAVLAFHADLEAELLRLQQELRSFSYRPGPYRQFPIRDPKPRLISAASYRDRVVHHALCAVIVPPLERRFHRGSFANRRGYGSHRALRRFVASARRHRWVLLGDIRLYFPSLDLTLLRHQLAQRIACPGTLWLLDRILANGASLGPALDAFPGDTLLTPLERPRGLPIGNLTSQFLANLHLDRFDHTISALAGIRAYLRYVDDFALFADQPEPLHRARSRIEEELTSLRLRHRAVISGRLSPQAARASLQSWNAHLAHGHTWRLRRRLFRDLPYAEGLPEGSALPTLNAEGSCSCCAAAPGTTTPGTAVRPTATTTTPATPTTTSGSAWSASPSTLQRPSRWKGFQRVHRKGPDPLP